MSLQRSTFDTEIEKKLHTRQCMKNRDTPPIFINADSSYD